MIEEVESKRWGKQSPGDCLPHSIRQALQPLPKAVYYVESRNAQNQWNSEELFWIKFDIHNINPNWVKTEHLLVKLQQRTVLRFKVHLPRRLPLCSSQFDPPHEHSNCEAKSSCSEEMEFRHSDHVKKIAGGTHQVRKTTTNCLFILLLISGDHSSFEQRCRYII